MADKGAAAHTGLVSNDFERDRAPEICGDPCVEFDKPVVGRLKSERHTELGLASRPLEENLKLAFDGESERATVIFFHHCQSKVDPCCHAR